MEGGRSWQRILCGASYGSCDQNGSHLRCPALLRVPPGPVQGNSNALIWVAVIIGIYSYIASKTTTGRYFYAVGGSRRQSSSGINTNRVYFLAYLNMGLLAAIAGMVTVARLNSINPRPETAMRMDAIGALLHRRRFRILAAPVQSQRLLWAQLLWAC